MSDVNYIGGKRPDYAAAVNEAFDRHERAESFYPAVDKRRNFVIDDNARTQRADVRTRILVELAAHTITCRADDCRTCTAVDRFIGTCPVA